MSRNDPAVVRGRSARRAAGVLALALLACASNASGTDYYRQVHATWAPTDPDLYWDYAYNWSFSPADLGVPGFYGIPAPNNQRIDNFNLAGDNLILNYTVSVEGGQVVGAPDVVVDRFYLLDGTVSLSHVTATDGGVWSGGMLDDSGLEFGGNSTIGSTDPTARLELDKGWLTNRGTSTLTSYGLISRFSGNVSNFGTLTLEDEADLMLGSGSATLTSELAGAITKVGPGTSEVQWAFQDYGQLTVAEGTLRLEGQSNHGGAITVDPGARLEFVGGDPGGVVHHNLAIHRSMFDIRSATVTNSGTIRLESPYLGAGAQSRWDNRAGSLFELVDDADATGGSPAADAFTNRAGATIRKSSGEDTSLFSWNLENAGTVEVLSGTLSLRGKTNHTGRVVVAHDAVLELDSSAHTFAPGSDLDIDGTLRLQSFSARIEAPPDVEVEQRMTGLVIDGNSTLTTERNLVVDSYVQTNGTFDGPGDLTATTGFVWTGGEILGEGRLVLQGTSSLGSPFSLGMLGRSVSNEGNATLSGDRAIVSPGITWTNSGHFHARLDLTGGADFLNDDDDTPATFINESGAVLLKSGGSESSVGWDLVNDGEIRAAEGRLHFYGDKVNRGTLAAEAGGSIRMINQTVMTGLSPRVVVEREGEVRGLVSLDGRTTLESDLAVEGGGEFRLSGYLEGPGDLRVDGRDGTLVVLSQAQLRGTGVIDFGAGSSVRLQVINILSQDVVSQARTTLTAAPFYATKGGWDNLVFGRFDITDDSDLLISGTPAVPPVFINEEGATLIKSGGNGVSEVRWDLVNAGLIDVRTGTLLLGGNTTLDGVADVTGGATLALDVKKHTLDGIAFDLSLNGTAEIRGGEVLVSRASNALGVGTFRWTGGTLAGPEELSLGNGRFEWTGGDLKADGRLDIRAGETTVTGNNQVVEGQITSERGVTLTGDALVGKGGTWTNQDTFAIAGDTSLLASDSGTGTFVNAHAATFVKSSGTGVSRIEWNFANGGHVRVESGILQFDGSFSQEWPGSVYAGADARVIFTGPAVIEGGLEGYWVVAPQLHHSNGTITPGSSPGTLTVLGDLFLSDDSILEMELSATGASDLLAVDGNLMLDGILRVVALDGFGPGLFTILTYTGALTDLGLELGDRPSGFLYDLFLDDASHRLMLRVSAVPEPGSLALVGLGLCGLAAIGRRGRARRRDA